MGYSKNQELRTENCNYASSYPISFFISEDFIADSNYYEVWHSPQAPIVSCTNRRMGTLESWIYQTWALLKKEGIICSLVTEPPQEGILIVHGDKTAPFLNDPETLSKNLFIVDIVADFPPHPSAHLHLVQNRAHSQRLPNSLFVPHWSQPYLIPRDPSRVSRFENIFFFGPSENSAPELASEEWNHQLRRELGLYFNIKESNCWHDYHDVDCVLAIRDFSRSRQLHKPATKLYNAWQAGVPFIGGRDSAYAADGHPGKDYLVATSPNQVLTHLKQLKKNAALRSRLVEQGFQSATSFTREATLAHWKKLIQETLPLLALKWQQKSARRRYYDFLFQRMACALDRHLIKR